MAALHLIIGNKAYSSWSLRPWLLMRHSNIAFSETRLPLYTSKWHDSIGNHSPTEKVPVLVDGETRIWDSLAICEYLHELFPERCLWPADLSDRALARAVSAEMHSGFMDLRTEMPMNMRRRMSLQVQTPGLAKDIERIVSIWDDLRQRFADSGPFLFGDFSIADAMFAPVVSRFKTYGVALQGHSASYADTILKLPALHAWFSDAQQETEVIEDYEL